MKNADQFVDVGFIAYLVDTSVKSFLAFFPICREHKDPLKGPDEKLKLYFDRAIFSIPSEFSNYLLIKFVIGSHWQ